MIMAYRTCPECGRFEYRQSYAPCTGCVDQEGDVESVEEDSKDYKGVYIWRAYSECREFYWYEVQHEDFEGETYKSVEEAREAINAAIEASIT